MHTPSSEFRTTKFSTSASRQLSRLTPSVFPILSIGAVMCRLATWMFWE